MYMYIFQADSAVSGRQLAKTTSERVKDDTGVPMKSARKRQTRRAPVWVHLWVGNFTRQDSFFARLRRNKSNPGSRNSPPVGPAS